MIIYENADLIVADTDPSGAVTSGRSERLAKAGPWKEFSAAMFPQLDEFGLRVSIKADNRSP